MSDNVLLIGWYYSLLKNSSFASYLKEQGCDVQLYAFFQQEKERFISKSQFIKREILCFIKLLFKILFLRNKKIFCTGGYYALLLVYKLVDPFLGKKSEIYIFNFYLHAAGKNKIVQTVIRFLFNNDKCTLIVQSPAEVDYYKRIIPTLKVYFVPYCTDPLEQHERGVKQINGDYIFTGGYTNRDYESVINCAKQLPDQLFVVVVSSLNTEVIKTLLPDNIMLYKDVSIVEFENLLGHSQIVIVPLKDDVGASGQMLCLAAMQNKKPIVYCDISSINYYFNKNSGIPYSLNNSDSMLQALTELINNNSLTKKLGENAYLYYTENFTNRHRNEQLYHIVKS